MMRTLEVTEQQMALFTNLHAAKVQCEQSLSVAFSAIVAGHGIGDGAQLRAFSTVGNTLTVELPDAP